MPIQVWLARMERSLTEQEYGDMMALLPDARRERLEKLPKEKHQEVLCAYLLLRMALWEHRGWRAEPGGVLLRGGCLSWLRGGCCCRTAGAAAAGAPSDAGPAPLTA